MTLPKDKQQIVTALQTKAALFDKEAENIEARLPTTANKYLVARKKYIAEQREMAKQCRLRAAKIVAEVTGELGQSC